MNLSKKNLDLIKENNIRFASFKYLDENNILRQIDCDVGNLSKLNLKLSIIPNKVFIDPFRSQPTVSFFCERFESQSHSFRKNIIISKESKEYNFFVNFTLVNHQYHEINSSSLADPDDVYANFRSDIIDTLEKINVKTSVHFYLSNQLDHFIGIKSDNLLDLIDCYIISKFVIRNLAYAYGMEVNLLSNTNSQSLIIDFGNRNIVDKIINNNLGFSIEEWGVSGVNELINNFNFIKIDYPSNRSEYDIYDLIL